MRTLAQICVIFWKNFRYQTLKNLHYSLEKI